MGHMKDENKVNRILFFIIALLMILIVVVIFYLFSNYKSDFQRNQESNQQDSEETTPGYDEIQTLLTTNEDAVKLYESISWPSCSKQLEYYYQQDKLLVKDMPHYLKQALAADKLDNEYNYGAFSLAELEQEYKQLFGTDEEFYFENIEEGSEICENEWICFNEIDDKYTAMIGDSTCVPSFTSEIVGIENNISKNEIYIYERVAFLDYINNDTERAKVYSDSKRTKLVDDDAFISNYYGVYYNKIDDYSKELDTYKYTFRENTQGNYNFISVERVK